MDRRIGRGTALILAFGLLALVELVLWVGDAANTEKVRRTLVGRLESAEEQAGGTRRLATHLGNGSASPVGRSTKKGASGTASKSKPKTETKIADPNSSCTVLGSVMNEEGQPIKAAKVSVRGPGKFNRSASTDSKGRFSISELPTGTFDLFASHSDYVALVRPGFSLSHEGQITEVQFQMPLATRLKGTVKDEEGKPLAGVLVAARRQSAEALADGSVYLDDTLYQTQRTDKSGNYTVSGLSLGGNVIEFRKAGYRMEVKKLTVRPAKEQPKLDITLRRTGTIKGVVLDEAGSPVSTVTVSLVRFKPVKGEEEVIEKGKLTAKSDENGRFKFSKLYTEGFYDISIDDSRYAPATFPQVPVGSPEVTCQLHEGGRIEGVTKYIDRSSTEAAVLLEAQSVIKGTTYTASTKSDGAGRFTFTRLPYGKYNLTVRTSGMVSEPKTGVPADRAKPTRDVVVEVYEASTVKGRVIDGSSDRPVPGAVVSLESSYGPGGARKKTFKARADQHGGFSFFRVPGGSHVAGATADGFLKTATDLSQAKFPLEPGERKVDLALVLDRGGVVSGYVTDTNEQPIDAAEVQLFVPSNIYNNTDDRKLKGTTDGSGRFEISGIEIGERVQVYASAIKAGYAKGRSQIVDLTPRQPEGTTHITLGPGGLISGKVTDRKDIPVGGALLRSDSSEFPGDPSPSYLTTKSRPDGSYVLEYVPAGLGRLSASRSGFVKQDRSLTVRTDKPMENVNFKLDAGLDISGTVEALDGKPITAATVLARAASRYARGTDRAITDGKGEFTLSNLGEGDFRLEATFKLPTPDGDQSYKFVNPQVPAGTTNAVVDCDVGNVLTGHIVDEEGTGIRGVTISLRSRDDILQNFTFDLDRKFPTPGSFIISKIPRGIYKISVTAPGYEAYIDDNLAVGPMRRTDLPRIKLRPAGGVVGEVYSTSNNRPVNGVRVRLLDPDAPNLATARELASSAVTDAYGLFRISTAMAGAYDVEFTHPHYQSQTISGINVNARHSTDLGRVRLESGGAIRGTVTDGAGNPLRDFRMRLSSESRIIRTDAAGNYLFQGIQPGQWTVVAQGRVGNRNIYTFQPALVEADETEQLDFQIDTSANLVGTLVMSEEGQIKSGSVQIHPFDESGIVLAGISYGASISRQGTFTIDEVPPGTYFLWSTGTHSSNSAFSAWQMINLRSGDNPLSVRMGSALVKGTARNAADNKPAKKVAVQLRPLFDTLRLPSKIYDELVRGVTTANNGKYSLPLLQDGAYQLLFRPSGSSWFAEPPLYLGEGQKVNAYDLSIPAAP